MTGEIDMDFFLYGQKPDLNLYIMRGIPGTGKSYRATQLSQRLGAPIFSADHFYGEGEEYKKNWSREKAHLGHRDCEAKTLAAMKGSAKSVIVDNTNLTLSGFRIYLDYAVDLGYAVYLVYPDSPWWTETVLPFLKQKQSNEASMVRAAEIAELLFLKNVHGVPKTILTDMLMKFQWVTLDDYIDANQQRVESMEKELADMKKRAKILDTLYL